RDDFPAISDPAAHRTAPNPSLMAVTLSAHAAKPWRYRRPNSRYDEQNPNPHHDMGKSLIGRALPWEGSKAPEFFSATVAGRFGRLDRPGGVLGSGLEAIQPVETCRVDKDLVRAVKARRTTKFAPHSSCFRKIAGCDVGPDLVPFRGRQQPIPGRLEDL